MAEYYIAPKSSFDATADAIREKTGSQAAIEWTEDGFADAIEAISGGGEEDHDQDDVILIDYDGTILHYYTSSEFMSLSSMPPNPEHTGLISQGWNWTLADAQEYVSENGRLTIGQSYTTDDGKNRFYINVPANNLTMHIHWNQNISNGVKLNWGDGSEDITVSGTGLLDFLVHTYSAPGNYCITLEQIDGRLTLNETFSYGADRKKLIKVELGNFYSLTGGSYTGAFNNCANLETINVPKGVLTSIGREVFIFCRKLKAFVVPDGVTSVKSVYTPWRGCEQLKFISLPKSVTSNLNGNDSSLSGLVRFETPPNVTKMTAGGLRSCIQLIIHSNVTEVQTYSGAMVLESVIIPNGQTSLSTNYASGCNCVVEDVVVPDTVTTINNNAFAYMYCNIHMLATTPPTLGASGVFSGGMTGRVIYVPYSVDHSVLEAYQTATNWSTYADYIQEEPQS